MAERIQAVRRALQRPSGWRRLLSRPAGVIGLVLTLLVLVTARFAETIATSRPDQVVAMERLPPSWAHPMGTNLLGRDLFSSVVYGVRTSMNVVIWVLVISSLIGIVIGIVAGYQGGLLDDLAMRVTELFQAVPRFFLAMMVLALFGPSTRNLTILLGVTSWSLLARVTRAEALSVRNRDFVAAARAAGASRARVLTRHILPNVLPAGLVVIALTGSRVVLIEATLRFLGLGDPNAVSLGSLARDGQASLQVSWWIALFPTIAIAIVAIGLNLLADGINEALNPMQSRRRLKRAMMLT